MQNRGVRPPWVSWVILLTIVAAGCNPRVSGPAATRSPLATATARDTAATCPPSSSMPASPTMTIVPSSPLLCLPVVVASEPGVPLLAGRFAYAALHGDNMDIFLLELGTRSIVRLTDNPANDSMPSWSPDGNKIALVSDRDGAQQIYTMSADGSEVTKVTSFSEVPVDPAFSPDGQRIVFSLLKVQGATSAKGDIYSMRADGSSVQRLTELGTMSRYPTWSPDGKRIAFAVESFRWHIYMVNADGTDLKELVVFPGADDVSAGFVTIRGMEWSPKGDEIAVGGSFELGFDGANIFAVNVLSGRVRQLTTRTEGSLDEDHPSWSPSGDMLAFHARLDERPCFRIYTMRTDGTGLAAVLDDAAMYLDWGP